MKGWVLSSTWTVWRKQFPVASPCLLMRNQAFHEKMSTIFHLKSAKEVMLAVSPRLLMSNWEMYERMSIIFHLTVQKKQMHVASLHLLSVNPKGKPPVITLHMKTFITTLSRFLRNLGTIPNCCIFWSYTRLISVNRSTFLTEINMTFLSFFIFYTFFLYVSSCIWVVYQ